MPHILLVDDNATNRQVLEQALKALGHRVSVAADGPSALQILAFERLDLVLLDIHMPRQSGLDVLQELRQFEGPNQFLPAICITADLVTRRPEDYLDLGFNGFLAKPVQMAKLVTVVDQALADSVEKVRREKMKSQLGALQARIRPQEGDAGPSSEGENDP
ncbi:MAG: response regulator [Phenylobacterium sp.]